MDNSDIRNLDVKNHSEPSMFEISKPYWVMLFAGLAVAMIGLHYLVTKPLEMQMAIMQQEIDLVHRQMN